MPIALITGASRGIGREVARTLATEGWHVLSGVRDPKSALTGTQPEVVDVQTPDRSRPWPSGFVRAISGWTHSSITPACIKHPRVRSGTSTCWARCD